MKKSSKANGSKNIERHLFNGLQKVLLDYFNRSKTWIVHHLTPSLHKKSEEIINKLTYEAGSSEWTVIRSSNRWNRYIVWTLVSVAGFGIVWAMLANVDETVASNGKLEPLGTTLDIKAPIGGVIKKILVKDGELVQEDQILLELDTTAAQARLDALLAVKERTLVDLLLSKSQLGLDIDESGLNNIQKLRLLALKDEFKSRILASQSSVLQAESQLDAAVKQLAAKRKALKIREEIFTNIKPLADQGAMSKAQVLKELEELELLRGEVQSLVANVARSEASVRETRNKLQNTKSLSLVDFSTKVEETEKQIAQLSNQISESRLTLKYQAIRSPKQGVVFDLQASSPGYVVNSEKPILKVVPTDNLVARVLVPNKDIGFLKLQQLVKVRVDAFPYNEFGELSGRIRSIGSDVLEPDEQFNFYRFPVTVDLDSTSLDYKGKSLPLVSGMSVTANIILRQRPVVAIFTQQILPFWDNLEKL